MISYSWPDGTLKWTGHSFAAEGALADSYHVAPGTPTEPKNKVNVTDSQSNVVVSTRKSCRDGRLMWVDEN